MKFISSRELRIHPGFVWKRLREEKDLVITNNGKPVGILTFIEEDSLEEVLTTLRQARAQAAACRIRQGATARGLHQLKDRHIQEIISRSRATTRKAASGTRRCKLCC